MHKKTFKCLMSNIFRELNINKIDETFRVLLTLNRNNNTRKNKWYKPIRSASG